VLVCDRMRSPAVTIKPDTPFQDALKLMHKHRARQLPIINHNGELIGMVSERDLLYVSPSPDTSLRVWELIYLISKLQERRVIDNNSINTTPELFVWELTNLLSKVSLQDLMTTDVITTTLDTPVKDVAHLMAENEIGGLPVVDEDNCVVGMIDQIDVLKAIVEHSAAGQSGLDLTSDVTTNEDIPVIDPRTTSDRSVRKGDAKMNRILVPLDGSALAERALKYAIMMAQELSAELILFRAVSLPADLIEILDETHLKKRTALEQLEAEANDYLCEVENRLESTGLKVSRVVWRGPAAAAIVDYAELTGVQQITMVSHGYGGVSRRRRGSVAERVLQSSNVPVLLVYAHGGEGLGLRRPEVLRRILVPLDGSHIAEQVIPPTTAVAKALDAEVVLFRVSLVYTSGSLAGDWCLPLAGSFETADQVAGVYLDRVADGLRAQGIKVSSVVRRGAVADAIIDYAENNRIDMIAMCTHGRTGLGRWTLGNVADCVLRARCTPVLLVRAQPTDHKVAEVDEQNALRVYQAEAGAANVFGLQ
jgi:nucleotide-binding universal stress UspA family protein/CBS domain-containing protein